VTAPATLAPEPSDCWRVVSPLHLQALRLTAECAALVVRGLAGEISQQALERAMPCLGQALVAVDRTAREAEGPEQDVPEARALHLCADAAKRLLQQTTAASRETNERRKRRWAPRVQATLAELAEALAALGLVGGGDG
jgi:hypothetical protein